MDWLAGLLAEESSYRRYLLVVIHQDIYKYQYWYPAVNHRDKSVVVAVVLVE